jgi:hypothetical protein
MGPKCLSRGKYLIPVVLLAFFLIGCSGENETDFAEGKSNSWTNKLFSRGPNPELSPSGNQQEGTYPIDPLFRAFYLTLGGEETLGPAISLATSQEDQTRQYLESGLMIFDPQAADSSRFTLAPLGLELGMGEGNLSGSNKDSGRMINGYLVNAEFLDLYESLGGSRFVGRPISEAHHNTAKRRVEQYFENLGFYQLDSETKIRLMPYGAYACDRNCRFQEPTAAIPGRQPILPEAFLEKTLELGLPFVGKPLTGLHIAPDGSQEVIFENLVLVAEAETPNDVTVRPIANKVGDHAQSPASPQDLPLSVFIEVEAGLGFNVPLYFVEYLNLFGGMGVAGQPVSEVFSPEPGIYWQCFTNLCLQFNLNVEGDQRLRPVPLGVVYKAESYDNVRDYEANQTLENLNIKVWEKGTFVSANESQEIHVALFENNKPLKNYEPILVVTMPDGSQRKAYFMPSDENGRTSLKLSPIEAPNGTLIAYRICLLGITEMPRCVGDNYLIWNAD